MFVVRPLGFDVLHLYSPTQLVVQPLCPYAFLLEMDVARGVEARHHVLDVTQDLGLGGIGVRPLRVEEKRVRVELLLSALHLRRDFMRDSMGCGLQTCEGMSQLSPGYVFFAQVPATLPLFS